MTDVQGHCPACGGKSLFLGEGGHVTCSRIDCPMPEMADTLLRGAKDAPPPPGVICPAVAFQGAQVLPLKGSPFPTRLVLTGDERARFTIDGIRYATSAEHPVIVEPSGPGSEGGFVTLTLIASKVTIDGAGLIDPAADGTERPAGCRCHNGDELCSGCHRCPDVCHGCDGPGPQPAINGKEASANE